MSRSHVALKLFIGFILVCLVLGAAVPAWAQNAVQPAAAMVVTVRYVKPTGVDSGTCTTWATACTLPYAIDQAVSGDEVWVKAGTYTPGALRTDSFHLQEGVKIYGGFTGYEASLSDRDWVENLTILSGELGTPENLYDNSYHVVFGTGSLTSAAVLDGFTIQDGRANGSTPNDRGGGMYLQGSNPTLTNLIFTGNYGMSGGGLNNFSESSPTLLNVTFTGNSAGSGGGMYSNGGSPRLINVTFSDNTVLNNGGGMYNTNSSTPVLINVVFNANTANQGAGMYDLTSTPTLTNVTFWNNSADTHGGGMFNYTSSPSLTNVTFYSNSAPSGGGAIYNSQDSDPLIYNSILWSNRPNQIVNAAAADVPTIYYSLIQFGCPAGATCDAHLLIANPQFYNTSLGDLRLSRTSPAIDAGNNTYLPYDVLDIDQDGDTTERYPFDLDNSTRLIDVPAIANTGSGAPPVDLGAYETNLIYVKISASGADNGTSWTDAFPSLADALATAQAGDEVWVAAGNYRPGTTRTDTFSLLNGLKLYGGFAGNETLLSEQDWEAHRTVLYGDIGVGGEPGDNIYHIVSASQADSTTVLDGFTIEDGYADGPTPNDRGGGIYLDYSSPTLSNLVLTANQGDAGGGMYCSNSSPRLSNVLFLENQSLSSAGAGMYNNASSPSLINVTFRGNFGGAYGAGMRNTNGSSPSLVNVTFVNNSASQGGALANLGSNPTLVNVSFTGNAAEYYGGGMYNDSSSPTLVNVTFSGNTADIYGGGIFNWENSNLVIQNSIIWGNTAPTGAEVYNLFPNNTLVISSTLISGGCPAGATCDDHLLTSDPQFGNAAAGDLRLLSTSPAIDAGSNAYLPTDSFDLDNDLNRSELLPLDLEYSTRRVDVPFTADTGSGTAPIVDLGAYETRIVFVDQAATGAGTGASWANAFPTLSGAFAAAQPGDEVWVAEGTYTPGTARTDSFNLLDGLKLYGGFAGGETALSQRDWVANLTTLSGDIGVAGTTTDNAYHVLMALGADLGVVDGFSIRSGYADGLTPDNRGAGMYIGSRSHILLENITFDNNIAATRGGGLYVSDSTPILNKVQFNGNAAGSGGGMANEYSSPEIMNVIFNDNTATLGGGGMYNSSTRPLLVNVTFIDNSAAQSGGGMYSETNTHATLVNVVFSGNSAEYGGAIGHFGGHLRLINSTLSGNTATTAGGALINHLNIDPVFQNAILWGNTAPTGPQTYSNDAMSIPIFSNSLVEGGCPANATCPDILLTSNPMFANAAGGDLRLTATSPAIDAGNNSLLITDTLDLDGDGIFAENLPYDLAGSPRQIDHPRADTGLGTAPIVDLGAYETSNTAPSLNNSGSPVLAAISEDQTTSSGTLVTAILASGAGGNPITDPDPGAIEGIAVTAAQTTNGAWQYHNGSGWTSLGPVSENAALLLPSDATAKLRFIPTANFNGTATLTFRAWDQSSGASYTTANVTANGGTTSFSAASETASITINPVNDLPTIANVGNQTTNEDTATSAIAFTVGDIDDDVALLAVAGESANTTLVPVANIVFGGSGANRTVTITPAANQSGTSMITLSVHDDDGFVSDTFVLTVIAVNDPPTISDIPNQATNENTPTGAISFTVGDVETAAAALTVSGSSANTTLVPNANIVFGGSGSSRSVTITPAANQSGNATITISVSDGSATATETFVLSVGAVNSPPSVSNTADQATNEDTATPAIAITISDIETAAGSLVLSAASSNTTLVPNANLVLGGSETNRTLTITPAPNQSGTTTITLTVSDGTDTATDTFVLTVAAVNDAPILGAIGSRSGVVGSELSFTATASDVDGDALTFSLDAGAPAGAGLDPATGAFTWTPGDAGTFEITIRVSDGTLEDFETITVTVTAESSGSQIYLPVIQRQ